MTTDTANIETGLVAAADGNAVRSRAAALWNAIDRFLTYAGDWLNPILVKETRQALKSSQFTITFVLVLAASWVVTIGVVAFIGPRIFYSAEGGTLLMWYYAVLAFPLLVVVPLSAFRSLTAEREDNTYDLLSITTLKPRQIISGKLGSSVAQMAVYFSVITPCLAFTYLLRGVDVPTIATLLFYTFFWSLGLSMVGILLATLTTQRFAQVIILVGFVSWLLFMFYCGVMLGVGTAYYGRSMFGGVGSAFWIALGIIATAYLTFFALAFFAAAGMITFTSENRSTPLRACMVVQQAAFIGWMAFGWISDKFEIGAVLAMAICAGLYWYAMGTLLTAERPNLSQRVRRRLPQSFFGRMFLSWFNPGPASGYMFVIANTSLIFLLGMFAIAFGEFFITSGRGGKPTIDEVVYTMIIGWGYVVGYLGIGLLVISALRRVAKVTMLASVLIHLLLLLAGFGIPYAVKSMSIELRETDYSFLQVTDPIFSIWHVLDGGATGDANALLILIPGVATCVLLLNMPRIIRELRVVREAAPARVLQDESELHPPPEALPQNPWDEPA